MPDQSKALSKIFEETEGYKSLSEALTKKIESMTEQLLILQSFEESALAKTLETEDNRLIQMF